MLDFPMAKSDPAYDQAWRVFRSAVRLQRIADRLWLVPPGVFVLGIIGFELVPNALDWRGPLWTVFLVLLAAVLAIRVVADLRLKNFSCPRCRQAFVAFSILQRAPLSTIERRFPCQHCNLPVAASAEQK